MMKLEEFAQNILAAVESRAEGVFHAGITTNTKNNGVKLTGITAAAEGSRSGPCIYLDELYKEYENGKMEFSEAEDEIYRQLTEHLDDMQGINLSGLLKWETSRGSIYAKLINAGQNKEQLETVPHRMFLDLAAVYYMEVEGIPGDGGMSCVLINNSHMEAWGQEEESLYEAAMLNMRLEGEAVLEDMNTLLRNILPAGINPFRGEGIPEPGISMYVLTNRRRLLGAAEILDSAALKGIADKLEDDFIVLPSSVHETIIIPLRGAPAYPELAGMVYEINMTQVDVQERLSNHVYVYERDKGELRTAA